MIRPRLDRRCSAGGRETFDQWRDDLKRRLRNVSSQMPAGELNDLVARMTRLRFKYRFTTAQPDRV